MRRILILLTAVFLTAGIAAGCGAVAEESAPVQSVAMLCGLTDIMQQQMYAGIVTTGSEANVKKDSNKKIAKVYVKKGDIVKAGDKLFTYDAEQAQNSLDKAKLELEQKKNALSSKQAEKKQLEKDKQKAKQDDQLDYTLKIQETDADIRQEEYEIGLKEKEILKLEEGTKNLDVTAPISGRVEKAGQADSNLTEMSSMDDDDGLDDDFDLDLSDDTSGSGGDVFIKLVEVDNYRIKGTIDETNISAIREGMMMKIYSRVNSEDVWSGVVSEIDMKSPGKGQSGSSYGYYGGDDGDDTEMTSTSKYPFYIKIDALEGLMIGQHVYLAEDYGMEDQGEIKLSSVFIVDADKDPWVWAEKNSVLARCPVVLGPYDADADVYVIESGLTADDFIAQPSDKLKEGMSVTENSMEAFETDNSGDAEDFYVDETGSDEEGWDEDDEEWTDDDEEWTDEDDFEYDEEDIAELEARYQAAGEEIVG